MLGSIPKASASEIVEKYKSILNIQPHLYDQIAREKLDNQCKEFQHFAKQMIPVLKAMIKNIATYMSNKSQSNSDYKTFLHMLDKYEELNLTTYVDGDDSKMVFGNQ